MIRLVLFDNDGTLSDSVPTCERATNAALIDAGYPKVTQAQVAHGMRLETNLRMMEHAGLDDLRRGDELSALFYDHWETISGHTPLFPGIPELLDRIHDENLTMGIVSNNRSDVVTRVMAASGVDHHFKLIIGEDNAVERKPAPGGLLQACRTLDIPPSETVYIGDGPSDPKAARAAGITSIGVEWNTLDPADVTTMNFDHLASSPENCLELIRRL